MKALWPLTDLERIAAMPQEAHTYLFITDEKGLALAIETCDR
jgi:hypothetical protein